MTRAELGFEEGFAVGFKGMEKELAIGGLDEGIHIRGREEIIAREDAGLVITGDIIASDADILRRGGIGQKRNSHAKTSSLSKRTVRKSTLIIRRAGCFIRFSLIKCYGTS